MYLDKVLTLLFFFPNISCWFIQQIVIWGLLYASHIPASRDAVVDQTDPVPALRALSDLRTSRHRYRG